MSQGALDKQRFEAIEAYVLGTMTTDQRVRFELEMANDTALRAEVELQREHTLAIELGGIERMMKSIAAEDEAGNRKMATTNWMQYLKYAAVVAIVLSASLWLLRPSANERLFAEHFSADPGLPVAMSATDDHAFHDAMVAYKLGDHAEARSKWTTLLQAEPNNDTLRYYIACASLSMDDAPAAIALLEGLANDPASAFHEKANWYLFLAYIEQGQMAKAKAFPFDEASTYGDRARAIKSELK